MRYIHKSRLYNNVPRAAAKAAGAKVISVRRIDKNKGGIECPSYRSRPVAREMQMENRTDLFAATPPVGATKVLYPRWHQVIQARHERPTCPELSHARPTDRHVDTCLFYTSDAADELLRVDLGGRRIIKKKKK